VSAAWRLVTAPAVEPLSIAEARLQCRVEVGDEDAILREAIVGSRQDAEEYLNRGVITQPWSLALGDWFDVIPLPMAAPLQNDPDATPSTAPVVTYYAADGTLTTLASSAFLVDVVSEPGRLLRAPNRVWPALQSDRQQRVFITYTVGWTAPHLVPQRIRDGIAVMVRARYERQTGDEWKRSVSAAQACWAASRVYWTPPSACAA